MGEIIAFVKSNPKREQNLKVSQPKLSGDSNHTKERLSISKAYFLPFLREQIFKKKNWNYSITKIKK